MRELFPNVKCCLYRIKGWGHLPAENARDTKGNDRHQDDHVHEGSICGHAGILCGQDERRSTLTVSVLGVEETLIGGRDQHADQCKTEYVEEGDAPEDLLDGRWEGCTDLISTRATGHYAGGMGDNSHLNGLALSAAVRPTSSVPAYEKAAVTKTEQKPRKPFWNAPGSYHRRAPQYSS